MLRRTLLAWFGAVSLAFTRGCSFPVSAPAADAKPAQDKYWEIPLCSPEDITLLTDQQRLELGLAYALEIASSPCSPGEIEYRLRLIEQTCPLLGRRTRQELRDIQSGPPLSRLVNPPKQSPTHGHIVGYSSAHQVSYRIQWDMATYLADRYFIHGPAKLSVVFHTGKAGEGANYWLCLPTHKQAAEASLRRLLSAMPGEVPEGVRQARAMLSA